jgi:hypothetical protein
VSLTIDEERKSDGSDQPDEPARPATTAVKPKATKKFWQRPWIIPLWIVTGLFLYFQAGPFVGTPETEALIPPHDGFPAYYPLLITHIVGGTIAMITANFQVWPWLRRRFPAVHRWSGRAYVVSTVVGAVCGLIILRFAPVVGQLGAFMSTTLWLITALVGYWAVRTNRYVLHRRFMLYSFALVMNNVWGLTAAKIIIEGGFNIDFTYLGEGARWIGWVVDLMLVQWFLYKTAKKPVEGPSRRRLANA